jgi:hypothetical protein
MRKCSCITIYIIIFGSLTFMAGCTPIFVIHVDGYPYPEEVNVSWSPDSSIAAMWFFSGWRLRKIENDNFSENIEYPDHLSSDIRNILPCDTKHVVLNLQIYNFSRKKYRLIKTATVGGRSEEEPIGEWTIRERQNLMIEGPVTPDEEIRFSVKVLSGENEKLKEPMISTEEIHYRIQSSNSCNPVPLRKGEGLERL